MYHSCSGPPLCGRPAWIKQNKKFHVAANTSWNVLPLTFLSWETREAKVEKKLGWCNSTYPPVGVTRGCDHDDLILVEGELLWSDRSAVHQSLDPLLMWPAARHLEETRSAGYSHCFLVQEPLGLVCCASYHGVPAGSRHTDEGGWRWRRRCWGRGLVKACVAPH